MLNIAREWEARSAPPTQKHEGENSEEGPGGNETTRAPPSHGSKWGQRQARGRQGKGTEGLVGEERQRRERQFKRAAIQGKASVG